ncbi:MAG: aldehyde ferredoxin oxidoreductase, partial [Desulfobacteraceae bacterium]|nr:aldehyde ferredoxin oxidoreductase [Desulfobacteraceae bacterium]
GATRNDPEKGDVLNHRYHDEPCKRGAIDVIGRYIVKDKFDVMVDEFYEHKGLDKKGIPKKSTLKELGLENEPSHLV